MAKIQRTPEEVEKIRQERAAKKAAHQAEIQKQLDEEQKNIVHQSLTSKQESKWSIKRKIDARHDYLRGKRKAYVRDRNLEKAVLEPEEIKEFIEILNLWEDNYEENISKIICEMLKYPCQELNDAAYKFLDNLLETKGMGLSFWFYALNREFIPNDLLRIMDKHSEILKSACAHMVLPAEMKKHLHWEEERLEVAKEISDPQKRELQIARVTKRIEMLRHLINNVYVYIR